MKHFVLDSIFAACFLGLAYDNFLLRRRLRVDRLAREAEDALGPPHIGDIVMPDPHDPRWTPKDMLFNSVGGYEVKRRVLALGEISVRDDGWVYVGEGPALDDSQAYGKRVLRAYKQRLIDQVRGSS